MLFSDNFVQVLHLSHSRASAFSKFLFVNHFLFHMMHVLSLLHFIHYKSYITCTSNFLYSTNNQTIFKVLLCIIQNVFLILRTRLCFARFIFINLSLYQIKAGTNITEIMAADTLATYRAAQNDFIELSFGTIAGYADHGAIIHYSATPETNVQIGTDSLFLLDSGGQYWGEAGL